MGLVLDFKINEAIMVTTPSGDDLKIYLSSTNPNSARLVFEGDRRKFNVCLERKFNRELAMRELNKEKQK